MECMAEKKEKGTVISLEGDFTDQEDRLALDEAVEKAVDAGEKLIVLDLGKITFMNSVTLGALTQSFTFAKKGNVEFRLANIPKKLMALLVMTKLTYIFEIYETVEKALNGDLT